MLSVSVMLYARGETGVRCGTDFQSKHVGMVLR